MKKIIFYISIIALIGTFQSCNDALNLTPQGFVAYKDMYNTKDQINLALNGMYNSLGSPGMYGTNLFIYTAIGNDESYYRSNSSPGNIGVFNHNTNSADNYVNNLWNSSYIGIDRANSIIAAMESSPADSLVKVSAMAQAKFVRAWIYFILADNFGGVPIRLQPTESFLSAAIARNTLLEVYTQVLKDMTEAEAILPTLNQLGATGLGRPSKSAAQALLARITLKMAGQPINDASKYKDAKDWADKVIKSTLHKLNPDYKQIFINQCQDKYDPKECLWEIEYTISPTGATTANFGLMGYRNGIQCADLDTGFCSGIVGPTKRLWDAYADVNDKRRDWNIAPYIFNSTTTLPIVTTRTFFTAVQIWDRYPGKWRREYELVKPKVKFQTGTNVPVIRYADVLLMYAEAENEMNGPTIEAFDAVNLVRLRAGAAAYNLTTVPTQAAFRAMIMDERLRELCFEGIRTHDLIRWGVYIPTMKALANDITLNAPPAFKFAATSGNNIADRDVWFPIPLSELTNNKLMVQNIGF